MTAEDITKELKVLRIKQNLRQKDVADRLGIAENTYCYYENNPYQMRLDMVLALSDIFGKDISNFFVPQNDTNCGKDT